MSTDHLHTRYECAVARASVLNGATSLELIEGAPLRCVLIECIDAGDPMVTAEDAESGIWPVRLIHPVTREVSDWQRLWAGHEVAPYVCEYSEWLRTGMVAA